MTPETLAEELHKLATDRRPFCLAGNGTKARLGAPAQCSAPVVSTASMRRLLKYEPRDLTISVEAGMSWRELENLLAENRQMIPLDPGWENSTVGGVVASNLSGPRRRLYGTARDMIIGMTFATLEGKLVQSGGMVVKNVAGLDMAKLMIGSFGTLAAIAVVNFKVFPMPAHSRTFEMQFATGAEAFAERDRILATSLQPAAIDIVNWPDGFRLLVGAGGSERVLDRYTRELHRAKIVDESVWNEICRFTPQFLSEHPKGAAVPLSMKLTEMPAAMESLQVPAVARAANGVIYAHYPENAPPIASNGEFAMMEKVKRMFDPERLLNPGRLYGRI